MSQRHFDRALSRLRDPDPAARRSGFDFILEHADSYAAPLAEAFTAETSPELRRLLLELIAEARSPTTLDLLAAHLADSDPLIRVWSARGLEALDTPDARRALATAPADLP
ncbi:HEAT repeat protein [Actinocorallia herbida]|uniref:HEAT repeat protein n=1 Tax=Actinocorallia herbida TaxID=58109 RepID=A0A3N1CZK0_9ACTN|nr:HEAT repeat domain-containing protein [Actinocorallia herbida]ROO86711.1 HEAT repeat protein [Actinocorallia herbida]